MEENNFNLPEAFASRMKEMLGSEWNSFYKSYLENNFHALRINKLKKGMSEEAIRHIFQTLSMTIPRPVPWAEDGYYYDETIHPGKHPFHEMGLYYIQEPSAMSAAALLAPHPGERVLDLCAAPGGKSTQLASYLKQEGLLVSNEINQARCKILAQNIERLGLSNVLVTNEDSKDLANHFPEFFHKILVDAPCSGEGMFRKNPNAMEEWSLDNVNLCAERQLMILDNAAKMLMHKGMLVYSTCTFAQNENEEVIYRFLSLHPDFILVHKDVKEFEPGHPEWIREEFVNSTIPTDVIRKTYRLWPNHLDGEGHYAAILFKGSKEEYQQSLSNSTDIVDNSSLENYSCYQTDSSNLIIDGSSSLKIKNEGIKNKEKKNTKKSSGKNTKGLSWGDKEQEKLLDEFLSTYLFEDCKNFLLSGKLLLFGDQLYRLPNECPSLQGLKVLRAGLHIGTFKKNRFEPSHALALFLGKDQVTLSYNLDITDSRVEAYFRGEAISVEEKNGWCLLLIDGMSAGWGKIGNQIMKNHYPKGLRINSFF